MVPSKIYELSWDDTCLLGKWRQLDFIILLYLIHQSSAMQTLVVWSQQSVQQSQTRNGSPVRLVGLQSAYNIPALSLFKFLSLRMQISMGIVPSMFVPWMRSISNFSHNPNSVGLAWKVQWYEDKTWVHSKCFWWKRRQKLRKRAVHSTYLHCSWKGIII